MARRAKSSAPADRSGAAYAQEQIGPPQWQSWPKSIARSIGQRSGALLWFAFALLLVLTGSLLVWFVDLYGNMQEQARAESAAEQLSDWTTRSLMANLQDIQAVASSSKGWSERAMEVLRDTKYVHRLERRDSNLIPVEAVDSPGGFPVFGVVPRYKAQTQALQACAAAAQPGIPVYSNSYFVPLGKGEGLEVVDLCVAEHDDATAQVKGFTVATIGLRRLLEIGLPDVVARDFEVSFVLNDHMRLARAGLSRSSLALPKGPPRFIAERPISVPGLQLIVRAENLRGRSPFELNLVTGSIIGLSLLVMTVLALYVRQVRWRAQGAALIRHQEERLQAAARLAVVGEVASLIGHEINQPLQSIVAWARAAQKIGKDKEMPKELGNILQEMLEEATRGAKVVKSVRDFVSRSHVQHEVLDMRELVEGVRPIIERLARDYGARLLEAEQPSSPLLVVCDRVMIEQVLLNLVRNGLQAMQRNPPHSARFLKISTRRMGDGRVRVSVSDTGPGVTDQLIAGVVSSDFKAFQRVNSEGLGLGLSLCRSVLQSHKGVLSCSNRKNRNPDTSKEYEGATFYFTLPRAPLTGATRESTNERGHDYDRTGPTTQGSLLS